MSFILDALKKSESDRQRHGGPALFEVKMAAPRTGLPPWAVAIVALLLVNLGIVTWMLLRRPHTQPAPGPQAGTASPGASAQPRAADSAPPAAAPAAPTPALNTTTGPGAPPVAAGAGPAVASAAPAGSGLLPATAARTADEPAGEPQNPQDYAPAADARATEGGHVRRATASGVTLYQDAAAGAGARLPQLRLDLHVFAARPQDRFVLINMHKLHEGDSLPEGVRVDDITPDGAVLSYNGTKFLLPRE